MSRNDHEEELEAELQDALDECANLSMQIVSLKADLEKAIQAGARILEEFTQDSSYVMEDGPRKAFLDEAGIVIDEAATQGERGGGMSEVAMLIVDLSEDMSISEVEQAVEAINGLNLKLKVVSFNWKNSWGTPGELPTKPAIVKPEEWSYCDTEDGNYEGREPTWYDAALLFYGNEFTNDDPERDTTSVYVGKAIPPKPPESYIDANSLIRDVQVQDDYILEWDEDWPDATQPQLDALTNQLRSLFGSWLDRHNLRPTFANISEIRCVTYAEALAAAEKAASEKGVNSQ